MDRIAPYRPTYKEVLQRGLQGESPPEETQPNRAPTNRGGKPPTPVSITSPKRPVKAERPIARERDWNARAMALAKEFVAAVLEGDPEKMDRAFFARQKGERKLYEIMHARRMCKQSPGWQSASVVEWFREAVKEYSIDQLRAIGEHIYEIVGATGLLFQEARTSLVFSVNERLLAHEFVDTFLERGDLATAFANFERLFITAQLDPLRTNQRMTALLYENLPDLSPDQEEWLAQAEDSPAVIMLRKVLRDLRALESSSNC
jgi:hypothetical protein